MYSIAWLVCMLEAQCSPAVIPPAVCCVPVCQFVTQNAVVYFLTYPGSTSQLFVKC